MKLVLFILVTLSIGWLNATDAVSAARISREEIVNRRPLGFIHRAVAILNPTKGSQVRGIVTFSQVEEGVRIVATVDGLSPGKHGFHIHEYGDCSSPDGSSVGEHYNPMNLNHGGPNHFERHVGDLGNIVADVCGHALYDHIDSIIQLNGPFSIIGRAIVVHANPDDYCTQPTGNSGGKISCGIIVDR
jgi:superoxide dismutase, Cu-Zn family